jgi:hypothetical protein
MVLRIFILYFMQSVKFEWISICKLFMDMQVLVASTQCDFTYIQVSGSVSNRVETASIRLKMGKGKV